MSRLRFEGWTHGSLVVTEYESCLCDIQHAITIVTDKAKRVCRFIRGLTLCNTSEFKKVKVG